MLSGILIFIWPQYFWKPAASPMDWNMYKVAPNLLETTLNVDATRSKRYSERIITFCSSFSFRPGVSSYESNVVEIDRTLLV